MDSPHLLHLGFLLLALAAPHPIIAMSSAGPANRTQGRITTVYYCKDYKYCTCKKDQNDLKAFTRIAEIQNKRNTISDVPVELVKNKSHITVCFEHADSSPEGMYGLYSDETGQPKIWCGNLNSGGNGEDTKEKNVCCEAEAVAWNHNSHLKCYIQKSLPKPTSLPIANPDEEMLGYPEFLISKSSSGILLAFLLVGVCTGWGTMFYFLRLRRRRAFEQDSILTEKSSHIHDITMSREKTPLPAASSSSLTMYSNQQNTD
ncbi:hypothetical protein DV515_00010007 [Chloebia gouldiae]|uniref:Uncharacterized protein n=1 Tax=Chloebia gouldiae TaxID=44316 RepID=A0A3L8SBD3_CHLGU|nr:hypothetical protein DV515_00010007 [Chloebia gouldiae]